jgi:hypothetical protein
LVMTVKPVNYPRVDGVVKPIRVWLTCEQHAEPGDQERRAGKHSDRPWPDGLRQQRLNRPWAHAVTLRAGTPAASVT